MGTIGHPLHELSEDNLARYSLNRGATRRLQRQRDKAFAFVFASQDKTYVRGRYHCALTES